MNKLPSSSSQFETTTAPFAEVQAIPSVAVAAYPSSPYNSHDSFVDSDENLLVIADATRVEEYLIDVDVEHTTRVYFDDDDDDDDYDYNNYNHRDDVHNNNSGRHSNSRASSTSSSLLVDTSRAIGDVATYAKQRFVEVDRKHCNVIGKTERVAFEGWKAVTQQVDCSRKRIAKTHQEILLPANRHLSRYSSRLLRAATATMPSLSSGGTSAAASGRTCSWSKKNL